MGPPHVLGADEAGAFQLDVAQRADHAAVVRFAGRGEEVQLAAAVRGGAAVVGQPAPFEAAHDGADGLLRQEHQLHQIFLPDAVGMLAEDVKRRQRVVRFAVALRERAVQAVHAEEVPVQVVQAPLQLPLLVELVHFAHPFLVGFRVFLPLQYSPTSDYMRSLRKKSNFGLLSLNPCELLEGNCFARRFFAAQRSLR